MAAAMEIMDSRVRAECDGPQAPRASTAPLRARVAAIGRARVEMLDRYDVRSCEEIGAGTFSNVYHAAVHGCVPPYALGPAWRLEARPLPVAIKMMVIPATPAIEREAMSRETTADEDNSGASPLPSECDDDDDGDDDAPDCAAAVDEDVLSNAYSSYDAEHDALERLGEGVTRTTDAAAPLLMPCLCSRQTLTLGMDVAVASLDDLPRWLRSHGAQFAPVFTWADTEHMIYSLFACLRHAHGRGLIHCDLVARNVLVYVARDAARNGAQYLQLRIGDWGSARRIDATTGTAAREKDHAANERHYLVTRVGRAPELIVADHAPFGPAIDIWAAGLLAVELIWGLPRNRHAIAGRCERRSLLVECASNSESGDGDGDDADDAPLLFNTAPEDETATGAAGGAGASAPVAFGARDIIYSIARAIGLPAKQSFMAPLVTNYCAGRALGARQREASAAVLADIARQSRPVCEYGGVVEALIRADGRHPESSRSVDEVAAAMHLDERARLTKRVMTILRASSGDGKRFIDDASCEGRVPASIKRLVYLCLQWNARVRPTASQLLATVRLWSAPVHQIAAHRIYLDDLLPTATCGSQ